MVLPSPFMNPHVWYVVVHFWGNNSQSGESSQAPWPRASWRGMMLRWQVRWLRWEPGMQDRMYATWHTWLKSMYNMYNMISMYIYIYIIYIHYLYIYTLYIYIHYIYIHYIYILDYMLYIYIHGTHTYIYIYIHTHTDMHMHMHM